MTVLFVLVVSVAGSSVEVRGLDRLCPSIGEDLVGPGWLVESVSVGL